MENTNATVGRALQEMYRRLNEAMADRLTEGQPVQYYDEGWRFGHVEKLPESDENRYGQVRIVHQATGRVWVDGRDIKPLSMDWSEYFAWKTGGDECARPEE